MFVVLGGCAAAGLYWSYGKENAQREKRCVQLEAQLENAVEGEKTHEVALRRAFLVAKEQSLAGEGDASVWFRYTL